MKYLLRKIKGHKWLKQSLTDDDVKVLLTDLQPIENKLSVYKVENDNDIEIVIAGLASTTREVKKVEFILIEEAELLTEGFGLLESGGITAVAEANELHRDIEVITDEELLKLAKLMHAKGKQDVKVKSNVESLLKKAYQDNKLNVSMMQHNLHVELKITCQC